MLRRAEARTRMAAATLASAKAQNSSSSSAARGPEATWVHYETLVLLKIWYGIIQYNIVWYNIIQYSIV